MGCIPVKCYLAELNQAELDHTVQLKLKKSADIKAKAAVQWNELAAVQHTSVHSQ